MGLRTRAVLGLVWLHVALGLALFLPAGSLQYWQAWVFLAVFFVSTAAITGYLMKKDPALLERRVKAGPTAERQTAQKVIQAAASVAFLALFVVSAFDHRLGWSGVPDWVCVLGDLDVALGLFVVFLVFRANTFTSAVIEVGAGQKVVSTGPYALVRHPMYLGALGMLLGVPPALGSWWGLPALVPMVIAIVWRLLDEERFLVESLPGYPEYQAKVKYRLLPFVW